MVVLQPVHVDARILQAVETEALKEEPACITVHGRLDPQDARKFTGEDLHTLQARQD